jgi:hypothetical protein
VAVAEPPAAADGDHNQGGETTMNSNNRFAVRARVASVALLLSIFFAASLSAAEDAPAAPKTYPTAEAVVDALIAAARSEDLSALITVLGESAEPLVSSGDDVADANARSRLVDQYDQTHELVADGTDKFTLEVGDDGWPFPFPIVKVGDQWAFDVDAGIDEVVYRRIGRNELGAMEACRGIVEAQKDYASDGHDGLPAGIYAQKLMSDPGKQNGLYWPSQPDERASPVGPFIATAAAEGYRKDAKEGPQPYHGYVYRLLTAQGAAAPGGARSYLKNGQLSGGFAVVAYPVEYEQSGVETFMINQDGVLYQKDLGSKTGELARAIKAFNPDSTWSKVD